MSNFFLLHFVKSLLKIIRKLPKRRLPPFPISRRLTFHTEAVARHRKHSIFTVVRELKHNHIHFSFRSIPNKRLDDLLIRNDLQELTRTLHHAVRIFHPGPILASHLEVRLKRGNSASRRGGKLLDEFSPRPGSVYFTTRSFDRLGNLKRIEFHIGII